MQGRQQLHCVHSKNNQIFPVNCDYLAVKTKRTPSWRRLTHSFFFFRFGDLGWISSRTLYMNSNITFALILFIFVVCLACVHGQGVSGCSDTCELAEDVKKRTKFTFCKDFLPIRMCVFLLNFLVPSVKLTIF